MLSVAIKSDAFIPYIFKDLIYKELLQTTFNFILNFLNLEFYPKNQVHVSNNALSNIFNKDTQL